MSYNLRSVLNPKVDELESKSDAGTVARRSRSRKLVGDNEEYKWPVGTEVGRLPLGN